jgi:uncharacterized protein with FMN-binding domain
MRRRVAAVLVTASLALPVVNGLAATPKRKVVTLWKEARGPAVQVERWGEMQVVLVVRKRTVTVGSKRTVTRKITAVRLPVWPNQGGSHTIHLNRKVIPILAQEVLREQWKTRIDVISEATDSSLGFSQSLQVALANGRRV